MSPLKKSSTAVDKLAKYQHGGEEGQAKDGADDAQEEDRHVEDTAKMLEAIAALQGTLTAKIDEVKIDISFLRQDLSTVTETETRISAA